MKNLSKNFLIVLLILLTVSALFALFAEPFKEKNEISLSQLVKDINEEKVDKIVVSGNSLEITFKDEVIATSRKEIESSLSETLSNFGVEKEKLASLTIDQKEEGGILVWLAPLSFLLLPILFFLGFFWIISRQAKGGIGQAFDFTKAKAKLFGANGETEEKVTFNDVAGAKEAKEELQEVIDFLKNPKKYHEIGARIPRGVLLVGAPGTGKTLLARAVATEAGVPFFSASGSEFIEMFVGVGSSRVRDLFATAKKAGRSIIFIDELDAIGRTRGSGFGGGHDEREQTLNQILVEMDGFDRNAETLVFAATNRPDVLDPALLRPGRFDRRVVLDLPDINDREAILKIHAREVPLDSKVNLRELGERTPGFSGADLANLINEAAILSAGRNKVKVSQNELLESIDKVLMGPERKSHVLSKDEKEITAYHEAGHALVATMLKNADPVRKVSIISRGSAGGYTLKLPREEKQLRTKSEFLDELAVLLGGYVAEKIVFNELSTGASNDLEKASEIARKMVKEYGMSDVLGPVTFNGKQRMSFIGGEDMEQKTYSDSVATEIDKEVAKFINNAEKAATQSIEKNKEVFERIAKALIEKETLEEKEFERIVKGV